jgi:hypothetical protein
MRTQTVTLISLKKSPITVPSFWARPKTRAVAQVFPEDSEYGNLINNWIPAQEDASILAELFVRLGFDATLFLGVLMGFVTERAVAQLLVAGLGHKDITRMAHKRILRLIQHTKEPKPNGTGTKPDKEEE